jgi:hypothetical protein
MTPGLWHPVEPPLPVKINIKPTLPIYCTIKFYDVKHRYIRYPYYTLPTLSFQIKFVKPEGLGYVNVAPNWLKQKIIFSR